MSPIQQLMQQAGVSERIAIGAAILFAKDRPVEFKQQFGSAAYDVLVKWAAEFETKA